MKLLLGTSNPAKVDEISLFLKGIPLDIVTLATLGISSDAPEHAASFAENAIMKASYYMQKTGLPTLADDGGIEIDALNGEPGVKSHRWINGETEDSDDDLIAFTMQKMRDIPLEQRGAQMHLVLAFAAPGKEPAITEGIVRGIVAEQPSSRRTKGFPFRSVFYLPDIAKYYDHNELTTDETIRYNHRRLAVERMVPIIQRYIGGQDA